MAEKAARKFRAIAPGFCLLIFASGPLLSAAEVDLSKLPPPATNKIDFVRDIKPILDTSCLRCHNPEKAKSGYRLDNRQAALKGGDHGVDIIAGDSAKSPLIHYTARLVEDMEMPPEGKGPPLTPAQISLLRAWIDQGVAWDTGAPANILDFTVSPTFGLTGVSGDARKFRELNWAREGANGGVEHFEIFEQHGPDTKVLITGHALLDDYKIDLRADRTDLGFIHAGWEQYRKYFDDHGGHYELFSPSSSTLNRDLYLDIGKAWIDFGLTLPNWPRLVLGYEYDYRQGQEAETDWGSVQQPAGGLSRNTLPSSMDIHEGVHILKFDYDQDIKGVTIEDRFRGEFYRLETQRTNFSPGPQLSGGRPTFHGFYAENVEESTHYFQGANTLRVEKKFNDWLFASAGYIYSRLNSDDTFDRLAVPVPGTPPTPSAAELLLPQITLQKESQVASASTLLGPFDGFTVSPAVQSEWTRQTGFGGGSLNAITPPTLFDPTVLGSDYDETSVEESLAVRYSRIPFTSLFAEAHLRQQTIGQSGNFALANPSDPNNHDGIDFSQQTDMTERMNDVRAGFNSSPWRSVSFNAHYRRVDDDSHYNNNQLQQPNGTPVIGYPGFITKRRLLSQEAEARVVLHPVFWFKTTLSYQYRTADSWTDTLQLSGAPGSTGRLTGQQVAQNFAINGTLTPTRRLFLNATFSYQPTRMITASSDTTAIAPYKGAVYSVIADGTFVLNPTTDLFAAYFYSAADYSQNIVNTGLPLGIEYEWHGLQAGISRRLGKNISARLEYRFNYYAEPTSGGATDFSAHTIFATLTYKFR